MKVAIQEPIAALIGEFFDSTALSGSFLGQIAKGLMAKSLSNYVSEDRREDFSRTRLGVAFARLSKKWSGQVLRDLSKLDMSDNEKKLLLALSVATLVSQVITSEKPNLETDIDEY